MTDTEIKLECELCYCKDPAKLHKREAKCVSKTPRHIYLCGFHNESIAGFKETIRCDCFRNRVNGFFSIYDPCSCMGVKDSALLPLPEKLCSEIQYLLPPQRDKSATIDEKDPTSRRCSRCTKGIQRATIYAKCKYCDDVYCSPKCGVEMATVCTTPTKEGIHEAVCQVCDWTDSDSDSES